MTLAFELQRKSFKPFIEPDGRPVDEVLYSTVFWGTSMLKLAFIALFIFTAVLPNLARAQTLQVLWVDPQAGPICAGPIGPGPCPVVANWIMTHSQQAVGMPMNNNLPTVIPLPQPGTPFTPNIPALNNAVSVGSVPGAIQCAQMTQQNQQVDVDTFLVCTHGAVALRPDDSMLVSCAEQANGDTTTLAQCAGRGVIASKLNPSQMKAVDCAFKNSDDEDGFAGCIGGLVADQLTPQQRKLLDCATDSDSDTTGYAVCAGQAMFGDKLSPQANAAISCAVQSEGDYAQFGACAANSFLNLNLNPEQQIAVECVVTTGGQPYAAGACIASALTVRELTKCVEHGFGGDGCFGDNNELVGRNGFVVRNIAALGGGPNSMVRNPAQVFGGPNSVLNNPNQLLGGPNSFPNQILRNVPSPPPLQVGSVGGHRVCIPWC